MMVGTAAMAAAAAHKIPLEVMGTVIEVADVAWGAIEHRREVKHHEAEEDELLADNLRLRAVLEENSAILYTLANSPNFSKDCPPDLFKRIMTAADSPSFLKNLESLHQESGTKESDNSSVTDPSYVDRKPHCWVWVTPETDLRNSEEACEIDNESYIIVSEDNVIDGVANFVANCILANPKSKMLTPEELQKSVAKALDDIKDRHMLSKLWTAAKVIYALSTWGIALAGLYRHRKFVKVAAKGIGATGKIIMKAL